MNDRRRNKGHRRSGNALKKFSNVFLRVQTGNEGRNNIVCQEGFEGGVAGDDNGFIFCLAEKLDIFIQRRARADNNAGKVSELIFQGRNAGVSLDRALVRLEISFPKIVESEEGSGFGGVLGSSLELSNVDLASEFVTMIQTQQAFQANARTITVTDDLLTEVVNLVR